MRCEVPLPLLGLLLCVGEWSGMGSHRDGEGLQGLQCTMHGSTAALGPAATSSGTGVYSCRLPE